MCSMSAAAPAIRRPFSRGLPVPWWRSNRTRALAAAAKQALPAAGAAQVTVVTGPLIAGWPATGPYDFILLNGATEVVPESLAKQLKPSGRLACIFKPGPAAKAMIYRLTEGRLWGRPVFDAAAPVLPGFVAPEAFVF